MKKRITAILVVIALLVTMFPMSALADTGNVLVFNEAYKPFGYKIRVYTNTTGPDSTQGGYVTNDRNVYLKWQDEWNFVAHDNDGYQFDGWTTSGSPSGAYVINGANLKILDKGNSNYRAYAHYSFIGYAVTLNLGDGATFNDTGLSTKAFTGLYPGMLSVPAYTVKPGYDLVGWDDSLDISGDATINARYEYLVDFVGNTGVTITGGTPVWTSGHTAPEPGYTVTGAPQWRFDGWNRSLSGITAPTTITANTAVEQGYLDLGITGNGHFVWPDNARGWHDIGSTVQLNKAVPLPDIFWLFTGWLNNSTGETLPKNYVATVSGDCTYTAIFESIGSRYVNAYAYGTNGRLDNNINGTYAQGTKIDLNTADPVPTTTGYEFKHWEEYIDSSSSWITVSENGAGEVWITVGVVNLYRAIFGLMDHTVTYRDEAGVSLGTEPVTHGQDATAGSLSLPSGTRVDESTGWRSQLNNITGDKTVIVTLEYEVTFDLDGGTRTGGGALSQWAAFHGAASAPLLDAPEGHHFDSWNKAFSDVTAETKVTALYDINTYDITTSVTHGTITSDQTVNHGSGCTIIYSADANYHLVSVTVDGTPLADLTGYETSYTFSGVDAAHTIAVVYEIDTYTIDTSVTGGTITPDQTVDYGSDCTIYYTPTSSGYHLIRVTVDSIDVDISTHPGSYTFNDVAANHTIDVEYEYRFKVTTNRSTVNGVIKVTYGTQVEYIAAGDSVTFTAVAGEDLVWFQGEPDAGYAFKWWNGKSNRIYSDDNGLRSRNIYDSTKFKPYAIFETIEYTITYNMDGGVNNVANPATYTIEDAEIVLADPDKTAYDFAAWTPDDTIPTGSMGDKVFDAEWTPTVYTITYNMDGGVNNVANPATYTIEDAEIVLADPDKTAYDFAAWTPDDTIPTGSMGDKVFDAEWTPTVYTITYNMDGGVNNVANPATYTIEDAEIVLADPTRTAYDFAAWSPGDTIPTGSMGDKVFDATWTPTVYTITYDLAGGSVTGVNPAIYTTESADITLINPTRTGYTFTGWEGTDIVDGTDSVTILTGSMDDRSYTATWAIIVYTVTFVDHDGVEIGTDVVAHGSDAVAPDDPTREGYTFSGWDRDFENVTSSFAVTATYTINTYTVTFVDHDGTVLKEQTVDWGKGAKAPDDPEWDGHDFDGWDKEFDNVKSTLTVTATYTEVSVVAPEAVPATKDTTTADIEEEPVPKSAGSAFPWWWIPIIGGVALLLFLILFFWKRRKKEEEAA